MSYRLGDFTVKNWNSWDHVPRDPVSIGIAIAGSIGVTSTIGTILVIGATSLAISAVTSWAISALSPKPDFSSFGSQGTLVNARDAAAPAEFVYGEVRKGGVVTFYESTGDQNKYLHQVIVLAAHEVEAIGDIYVNDEVVTLGAPEFDIYTYELSYYRDSEGGGTTQTATVTSSVNLSVGSISDQQLRSLLPLAARDGASDGEITSKEVSDTLGPEYVTGDTWKSKIRIQKFDGSQTSGPTALIDESEIEGSNALDENFVGNGIAYLYVRYEYDQDVFASGLPLVTAKIQGKKVYDPRTDTTAYSNNAALCIRDFITSEYGLNDSAIDEVSFSAAANESDELVDFSGGGNEKRYTINGIIKASSPIGDVLGKMSTACAGTLFWGSGYWKLKVGAYSTPVKTLTLDDLRGPINMQTRSTMRDSFNGVSGTFNNASDDFITADYPPIKSSTFQAEDGGDELLLDLPLPFTTSAAAAQRIAKLTLYRGREQMTISADFGLEAFNVEVGDIIAFTNERYGFDEKEFEVVGWKFASNQEAGDLRVTLTLQETSAAAFDWNAEETEIISNNTTLPVYTAGMSILGLSVSEGGLTQSDGTRISTAIVDWSDVTNAYLERYEVQWRPTADTSYSSTLTSESVIELSPIIDGVEYTFRVRAVSANGYRGPFASVTFTGGGDVVPPAVPTNLSAVGGYKYITVSFDTPTDYDFSQVEVYENTISDLGSASSIGRTSGNEFIRANLSNSATRFYWVRSVDLSGNASAFVGPVSATTALIEGVDLTASLLETIEQAGVTPVNSLPASGDYDGQLVFLLTDNTLYRWDDAGSAWSTELFTDIKDDSITTDKIAASAIVASKIAAGAVTADKINVSELSAITADLGTIQVGTANIADAAITNAKISNLSADKITTGVLNADVINSDDITKSQSGSTAGNVTIGSNTNIQQLTVTTVGRPVDITFLCDVTDYVGVEFKLYRDDTLLATHYGGCRFDFDRYWTGSGFNFDQTRLSATNTFSMGYSDTPSAGTYTYKVTATNRSVTYSGDVFGLSVGIRNRYLKVTEFRK